VALRALALYEGALANPQYHYPAVPGLSDAGWPLTVAGGCTFADVDDHYGGHTGGEYMSAYDWLTGLPKDRLSGLPGVGYTC
jgi:hypothetical protein